MTQLSEQGAVGGSDEPIIAAEPTLEDRLAAAIGSQEEEDPAQPGTEEAPQGAEVEPELTADDVIEGEAEAGEESELPPITPPVSWTGENKAKFAELPRDVQEYIAERETHREKFVQEKAQEAAKTRSVVEQQAVEAITNLQAQYVQGLQLLLPSVPAKPSHQLQADDPWEYAAQMDHWERTVAHRQYAEQQIAGIVQQQQAAQQARQAQVQAQAQALLQEKFPEYLDATEDPKHKARLEPIAQRLGYSLADMDGTDIIALREVASAFEKSDKYDALMSQKMAKVRAAKDLPRVSRPGAAQPAGAAANARYQADRDAMRHGDMDAAARAVARHL